MIRDTVEQYFQSNITRETLDNHGHHYRTSNIMTRTVGIKRHSMPALSAIKLTKTKTPSLNPISPKRPALLPCCLFPRTLTTRRRRPHAQHTRHRCRACGTPCNQRLTSPEPPPAKPLLFEARPKFDHLAHKRHHDTVADPVPE